MKIYHIALGSPEFDRAAIEEGHEIRRINWRDVIGDLATPHTSQKLAQAILNDCQRFRPDVVFMQLQTPNIVHPYLLNELRSLGAFVINWTGDVRDPLPSVYTDLAPYVDVTAFTNMPDVKAVRAMGWRAEYLQIGYDPTIYGDDNGPRNGVVFIGNDYRNRFPESESRRDLVNHLKRKFGNAFTAYGNGFGARTMGAGHERAIYNSSLVAVNWDHFRRPYFASDRILRAQACGCAVVSQAYEGLMEEHPWTVGGDTIDRVVELVELRLSTPYITKRIGQDAAEHTFAHHRWNNRIRTIETWLKS